MIKEDWIECKLGDLLTLKNGFAFKSSRYTSEGIPVIRIGDINDWIVDESQAKCIAEEDEYDKYIVEKGDILIAMSGATTGKFGIYNSIRKAYQNQRVGNLKLNSKKFIDKKYIFNLLYSLKFQIEKDAYGGAQPNISAGKIHALKTVLAPLPEQRAIVSKIEELFSDLDKGVADLKKAQDQLKVYRQAVLKKAFEGEFTKEWREQQTKNEEWESLTFNDVLEIISGKNQKHVEDPNGKYPIYGSGGIFGKSNQYLCEAGTTIIGRKGTINSPIYVNERFWNVDTAFGLSPSGKISSLFLFYFCLGFNFKRLDKSTTIPSLAKRDLLKIHINIPPQEEQHHIVQEIESRLSVCDKVEESITGSLEKAEVLRQSILKKAFEGNLLLTQEIEKCKTEPDYEPAAVLLEKIKNL